MRSIFFALFAHGAVASECQAADESTMLQINRMKIKNHYENKAYDARSVLKNIRHVASSMVEGSHTKLSKDTVDDALANANTALQTLSPAIQQQVTVAQQQINDASAAVVLCHNEEQAEVRASLLDTADQYAAAVQSCQNTLDQLQDAETQQCGIAEDCLCDEARVRTADQETLCAARLETYNNAFCEHNHVCTIFAQCHFAEGDVYTTLVADTQAEMAVVEQEYIAAEQSTCLVGLMMTSMATGTPIPLDDMLACNNVDTTALAINYPALPAQPAPCPTASFGTPVCGTWQLIARHDYASGQKFDSAARNTFLQNENDPTAAVFMNVGQLASEDYVIDGKFHLKLIYTGVVDAHTPCNDGVITDRQEFEWTQTSWITDATVSGYEPVTNAALAASPEPGCVFSGLAPSGDARTVFDGSHTHGYWFHSVGSNTDWNGGIPAFKGGDAQGMSLYVRRAPSFSHVHNGHCAGGWLGGNSNQESPSACSAHCRATADCRYFAFCAGPTGCDGSTNCALYNEAAGCPDDDNWGAYEAYINH